MSTAVRATRAMARCSRGLRPAARGQRGTDQRDQSWKWHERTAAALIVSASGLGSASSSSGPSGLPPAGSPLPGPHTAIAHTAVAHTVVGKPVFDDG